MPECECPVNGGKCVSIERVEALERALEEERDRRSSAQEKIYDRLGTLERGMATVTTQYANIVIRLETIALDLNTIKERPGKRWETALAAVITGVVGFLLARFGMG